MATGVARVSRDDYKKLKEIEDARKAGTLAPEVDRDGNMINPHMPQYMSVAPWYLNQEADEGLKHQRFKKKRDDMYDKSFEWYKRTKFKEKATKYRKGACKNCGAMTHKERDCVERPRRLNAAKTNSNIAPDEFVHNLPNLSWDARRDRWNGVDAKAHMKQLMRRHKLTEDEIRKQKIAHEEDAATRKAKKEAAKAAKKKAKVAQIANSMNDNDSDSDSDSDNESGDDSDDALDMKEIELAHERGNDGVQQGNVLSMARNLRQREDMPKYLRNLDPNSAYYDPKTRSMRVNPNPHMDASETDYLGDNAYRHSGDVKTFAQSQLFAWDSSKRGTGLNMTADPTAAALLQQQFKDRKSKLQTSRKDKILSKYGGSEHMVAPEDESLLTGASERYVEYSMDGRVIKGEEKVAPLTKYELSLPPITGRHSSIWGSFYDKNALQWGYACCHSCVRNSYCTGESGKAAFAESASMSAKGSTIRKMIPVTTSDAPKRKRDTMSDKYGVTAEEMENYHQNKSNSYLDPMVSSNRQDDDSEVKSKKDGGRNRNRNNAGSSDSDSSSSDSDAHTERHRKKRKIEKKRKKKKGKKSSKRR